MKLLRANFWDVYLNYDIACITTNGFVKNNGCGVMGRGIALQASQRFPQLPAILGAKVRKNGNKVQSLILVNNTAITAFPVKHNWWEDADIELIKRSCNQLMSIVNAHNFSDVLLNMPGVGNGKLNFNTVKDVIEKILDDRVTVIYQ